VAEAK